MAHMSMLVFFPWLQLDTSITVGDFTLIPYERGCMPGGHGSDVQATLDAITEAYLTQVKQPIRHATLVRIGQGDLTRDLDEQERRATFVLSELLAVCGLSCRQFFQSGNLDYWNRDNFRLVVQTFANPHMGVAVTTRRRDGSTTNYSSKGIYLVHEPEHVFSHTIVCIDHPLLEALFRVQGAGTWDPYWESMVYFNLANTDNMDMAEQVEVVLLNGAFERLLDCHRGKEDDVAERFAHTLTPTTDRAPHTCARLSGPGVPNSLTRSATIREMWMRDFFRLRRSHAHGKLVPTPQPVWPIRDHLLLASFVFPLLLKCRLAQEGFYQLSEKDQCELDVFEPLACQEHFASVSNPSDPQAHPWNRLIDEAMRESIRRRIAAQVQEEWEKRKSD
jgi:hypothetical protein